MNNFLACWMVEEGYGLQLLGLFFLLTVLTSDIDFALRKDIFYAGTSDLMNNDSFSRSAEETFISTMNREKKRKLVIDYCCISCLLLCIWCNYYVIT